MVNYSGHNEKVKIQVTSPDQNNYTYPVTYLNQFVTYPLPGGNGTYKITVLESVDLTKNLYATCFTQQIDVSLENEYLPFLYSNYYISFNKDSLCVKKAQQLAKKCYSSLDVVSNVYNYIIKNIKYVGEYGRFDDLLVLLYTDCKEYVIKFIKEQLEQDIDLMAEGKNISLLAKWLPSVNASNKATKYNARKIAKALEMDNCEYRKMLSRLRNYIKIIENNLREKDYTFDYSYQPSKALMKYRKAFIRNDKDRYSEFLQDVQSGNAKINTETLTPYDIIAPIINEDIEISDEERKSLDVTWDNQADCTNDENAVVVADTSGSMYWCSATPKPISVAFSLAIYFAERNSGDFKNHFITFSCNPQLVEIKGKDIYEKVKYCETFAECANTDIQAVFDLVLSTAVKNKTLPEDMPSKLYIISDMEFDYCAENSDVTNFEYAKEKFEQNGYALPKVVFWNVASRNMQSPVEMNEQGVTLVSGCNPRIFSMVTEDKCTPYEYMLDVLNQERYADIKA